MVTVAERVTVPLPSSTAHMIVNGPFRTDVESKSPIAGVHDAVAFDRGTIARAAIEIVPRTVAPSAGLVIVTVASDRTGSERSAGTNVTSGVVDNGGWRGGRASWLV